MSSSHPTPGPGNWFSHLAAGLDRRSAARLAGLFLGAVVAVGRQTVTGWIRAAGLSADFRPCYTAVAAAGRAADLIAGLLVTAVVRPLVAGFDRLTFAVDDTPTPRAGRRVQGAGIHHNPTPGPAGAAFVYGHVWVVLALVARHAAWGAIALPLLARLYVRATDLPGIGRRHRPAFRTKLALAVELVRWAVRWLGLPGKPVWVVADGAYATAAFLKPLKRLGVTVVSRLRKDAALWTAPAPRRPGRRGRPRVYGDRRISLAGRAGHRRGWVRGTFAVYGKAAVKRYKTFVATWRPAGGAIRVVLLKEAHGWVAFFCSDPAAPVADVLAAAADRFTIETAFRDCKQVVGAGRQQVRRVRASVGAFHLCLWTYTMTEAWAWGRPPAGLADRSAAPWDDPGRRPSHADKRRAWRRELLAEQFRAALRPLADDAKIRAAADRLLNLAA